MIDVDFLLVCEHKARELENLCLLKLELEHRGYSVAIVSCVEMSRKLRPVYKAEVVFAPAAINNNSASFYLGKYVSYKKLINMMCEQVVIPITESIEWNKIEGVGNDAYYLSWGVHNRDYLINERGQNDNNVKVCGHIAMDFWKPIFDDYFKGKEDLSAEFGLNIDAKWTLFISSFSTTGLSIDEVETFAKKTGLDWYIRAYKDYKRTQNIILDWFEYSLVQRPDIILIYRPHPAERQIKRLREMEKTYKNFRVIGNGSVRQWIKVCDRLYTWVSTSIADVFFSGKKSYVLRPIPIEENKDIPLFKGCHFICDFDDYKLTLDDKIEASINSELINEYYMFDERYSFGLVANACESIYKSEDRVVRDSNKESLKMFQKMEFKKLSLKGRIRALLNNLDIFIYIYQHVITIPVIKSLIKRDNIDEKFKEYITEKEIVEFENRLKPILQTYWEQKL